MPIRFRCTYCNRLLGIATRKAGTETTCPHCGYQITVPVPNHDNDSKTERVNLDDVEEMLGRGATEALPEPAVAAVSSASQTAATTPPPAAEKPRPEPTHVEPPRPPAVAAPKLAPAPVPPPAPPAAKPRPAPPPVPKAPPKSTNPDDRPLFEADVDEILGTTAEPEEPERAKPPKTSGMDAMSLGDPPRQIILSAQTATLLVVAVMVLMAVAFAVGYFLAPKN